MTQFIHYFIVTAITIGASYIEALIDKKEIKEAIKWRKMGLDHEKSTAPRIALGIIFFIALIISMVVLYDLHGMELFIASSLLMLRSIVTYGFFFWIFLNKVMAWPTLHIGTTAKFDRTMRDWFGGYSEIAVLIIYIISMLVLSNTYNMYVFNLTN